MTRLPKLDRESAIARSEAAFENQNGDGASSVSVGQVVVKKVSPAPLVNCVMAASFPLESFAKKSILG